LGLDYSHLSIDSIVFLLKNLTVVPTILWPWITAKLSIDSIVLLLKKLTVVSTIFGLGI